MRSFRFCTTKDFAAQKKRGPKTLKELNVKGQQYPIAEQMIKSGTLPSFEPTEAE